MTCTMVSINLFDISASLSSLITEWAPPYAIVKDVMATNRFHLSPVKVPRSPQNFFAADLNNCILTAKEKEYIFLQYHRSFRCEKYVRAFALALRKLCDAGINLLHEDDPVVDIWVMHVEDLDVFDIPKGRILNLTDPVSGITLSSLSTYENIEKLRALDQRVCDVLAFGDRGSHIRLAISRYYNPINDKSSNPHWWIAAVVEGKRLGKMQTRLVHIDICGAAYDDRAFLQYNESLVSLQMFTTPHYELLPVSQLPSFMKSVNSERSFIMTPYTRATNMVCRLETPLLQPFSVRHMRGYYKKDESTVLVTPLETYLAQVPQNLREGITTWLPLICVIQRKLMLKVRPGTVITMSNMLDEPKLNGTRGIVCCRDNPSRDGNRVPVRYRDGRRKGSLLLRTVCFQLKPCKQYLTHAEFLRTVLETSLAPIADPDDRQASDNDHRLFLNAIRQDKYMRYAYGVLCTGKVIFKFLENVRFTRDLLKLLQSPYHRVLQASQANFVADCKRICDHSKFSEALQLLCSLDYGREGNKSRMGHMDGNGVVATNECRDFSSLCCHVRASIIQNHEVGQVLEMMEQCGLCINIADHLQYLHDLEMFLDHKAAQ